MTYLTYGEYAEMGGICDLTAFNRNIDRACGIIDNATHNRIECMAEVPQRAKALCRDLVEHLVENNGVKIVTSKSQSAGGVSESESYATKTADDVYGDIQNMIYDYLLNVTDDNGTPLLYRGCSR
jgi:uncharacterized protein with PIN domain